MKLLIISVASAILAGMGIGGGALFVMLSTTFLEFNQLDAQALNLFMFISAGLSSTISNFKNKKIDKDILKKVVPLIIMGVILGNIILQKIQKENLKLYFSIFMAILGLYEIISSLINRKKGKTNNKK